MISHLSRVYPALPWKPVGIGLNFAKTHKGINSIENKLIKYNEADVGAEHFVRSDRKFIAFTIDGRVKRLCNVCMLSKTHPSSEVLILDANWLETQRPRLRIDKNSSDEKELLSAID